MSHRVTLQTQITNKVLAIQALNNVGWSYQERGTVLSITGGPMRNASLDTRTGMITGDSDYHKKGNLSDLNRSYAEVLIRAEAIKKGHTVESREVLKNGDIRLVLTANFG